MNNAAKQPKSARAIKREAGVFVFKFFRGLLLFGLCFLILQPLLDKLSVSFMAQDDLYDATVISIPRNFSTENYSIAGDLLKFWPSKIGRNINAGSLFRTLFVLLASAVLQISACTLAAYGFARYKFPLRNVLFGCVMLIIVVPPQTIMSSLYLNFRFFDIFGLIKLFSGATVNLLENVAGFWLLSLTGMGLKSGLYIFMLRQYFRGVPKELEEAAYVDGCGRFRTFIQIMIPDAAPMLTSCFLFSFVWQWTDTLFANLFLQKYKLLASELGRLAELFAQWWGVVNRIAGAGGGAGAMAPMGYTQAIIATGMLMCLAPLVLLYLVAQRAFVESLSQTGIKM